MTVRSRLLRRRSGRQWPWQVWHVDAVTSQEYAHGTLAEADCWSVEKHLEGCASCAGRVSAAVARTSAAPLLAEVRGSLLAVCEPAAEQVGVDPPRRRDDAFPLSTTSASDQGSGAVQARPPMVAAGVGAGVALWGRLLWAAGPALRGAWLVALLLVCAGAIGLAHGLGAHSARPMLLALAPLLPLAGVALSYGPRSDPLHEITASTPSGGLRLLLIRSMAVLGVSLPLLTSVGAFLPAPAGVPSAATWLLPGVALTLATLALSSFVGCRLAAGTVASGWCFAVLVPLSGEAAGSQAHHTFTALVDQLTQYFGGPAAQSSWAVAAALCACLLAFRRHAFDRAHQRGIR